MNQLSIVPTQAYPLDQPYFAANESSFPRRTFFLPAGARRMGETGIIGAAIAVGNAIFYPRERAFAAFPSHSDKLMQA